MQFSTAIRKIMELLPSVRKWLSLLIRNPMILFPSRLWFSSGKAPKGFPLEPGEKIPLMAPIPSKNTYSPNGSGPFRRKNQLRQFASSIRNSSSRKKSSGSFLNLWLIRQLIFLLLKELESRLLDLESSPDFWKLEQLSRSPWLGLCWI